MKVILKKDSYEQKAGVIIEAIESVSGDIILMPGKMMLCYKLANSNEIEILEPITSEEDLDMMMAFRGEHWDLWIKFCIESGREPEISN